MTTVYNLPKGKVLVLRTCSPELKSHGGFTWKESGNVKALDWEATADCGRGLHGWLWAVGDFSLKNNDPKAKWLVCEVSEKDIIDLDGKVKFPKCKVVFCGSFRPAYDLVMKWYWLLNADKIKESTTGESAHASTTGESAHASTTGKYAHASTTGWSAHASTTGESAHASTTGKYAHASTTGESAHASTTGKSAHASTTGESAHASTTGGSAHASTTGGSAHASTTGESAHASTTGKYAHASTTGWSAHASTTGESAHASTTGKYAHASTIGTNCKAQCGELGAIILTYWDGNRYRHVIGYDGENGVEAGKWYSLNSNNEIVETTKP